LDAVAKLLDDKKMRLADLFRHPRYNPSYLQQGDEKLKPAEIAQILKKAGLELSIKECESLVEHLDADCGGDICIDEFDAALRMHRRGNAVWETEEFKKRQSTAKQQQQRSISKGRLMQLYARHQERLDRLEEKKASIEAAEQAQIEKEKQELRMYCGKPPEVDREQHAGHLGKRLYEDGFRREHRWRETRNRLELEERAKLEESRSKPHSASSPQLLTMRHVHAQVGRLYQEALNVQVGVRASREAQIAAEMLDMDAVGKKSKQRTPEDVHKQRAPEDVYLRLHLHAERRMENMEKLQQARQKELVSEGEAIEAEVKKRRAKVRAKPLNEVRIQELHRVKDWEKEAKKEHERELAKIAQEAADARKHTADALKHVRSKVMKSLQEGSSKPGSPVSPISAEQTQALANLRVPLGFGSTVARRTSKSMGMRKSVAIASGQMMRAASMRRAKLCKTTVEPAEHAIRAVNAAVSMRAGCVPEDASEKFLNSLGDTMREVLGLYRDAGEDSERSNDSAGVTYLRLQPSRRIYACGALLEEPRGWHECTEAQPICQLHMDFDEVMATGRQAHLHLLARVGPEERSPDLAQLESRWPAGTKWNNPGLTRKAMFAYNPGPKSDEAASAKAFVRYAPADEAVSPLARYRMRVARFQRRRLAPVRLGAGPRSVRGGGCSKSLPPQPQQHLRRSFHLRVCCDCR